MSLGRHSPLFFFDRRGGLVGDRQGAPRVSALGGGRTLWSPCLPRAPPCPPPPADFSDLLRQQYRRPLAVGLSLMLFQQITGQPSVLYYAARIFQVSAGCWAVGCAARCGGVWCDVARFGCGALLGVPRDGRCVVPSKPGMWLAVWA